MLRAIRNATQARGFLDNDNGLPDKLPYSKSFDNAEEKFKQWMAVNATEPSAKTAFQRGMDAANGVVDAEVSPARLRYEMHKAIFEASRPTIHLQQVVLDDRHTDTVVEQAGLIYAIEREKMKSFAYVTYKVWKENIYGRIREKQCRDADKGRFFRDNFINLKDAFEENPKMLQWIDEYVLLKLPVTNLSTYCQFPQLQLDADGNITEHLVPFCEASKIQIYIKSTKSTASKRLFGSSKFLVDLRSESYFSEFEPEEDARQHILLFTMYICRRETDVTKTLDLSTAENVNAFTSLYETFFKDKEQSNFNKITTYVEQIITLAKSTNVSRQQLAQTELEKLIKFYDCRQRKESFKSCFAEMGNTRLGVKIAQKTRVKEQSELNCDSHEMFYTTGSKLGLTQGASSVKKVTVYKRDKSGKGNVSQETFYACKSRSKGGAKFLLNFSPNGWTNFVNLYVATIMNKRVNAYLKNNNLFRAKNGQIMHKLASTFVLLGNGEKDKQDLYKFVRRKLLVGDSLDTLEDFAEFLDNEAVKEKRPQKTTIEGLNLDNAGNTLRNLRRKAAGDVQVTVLNPAQILRLAGIPNLPVATISAERAAGAQAVAGPQALAPVPVAAAVFQQRVPEQRVLAFAQ
jgi:hypothetical protein